MRWTPTSPSITAISRIRTAISKCRWNLFLFHNHKQNICVFESAQMFLITGWKPRPFMLLFDCSDQCGGIAQLGARLTGSQKVRGSSPLISTIWFILLFFYSFWQSGIAALFLFVVVRKNSYFLPTALNRSFLFFRFRDIDLYCLCCLTDRRTQRYVTLLWCLTIDKIDCLIYQPLIVH